MTFWAVGGFAGLCAHVSWLRGHLHCPGRPTRARNDLAKSLCLFWGAVGLGLPLRKPLTSLFPGADDGGLRGWQVPPQGPSSLLCAKGPKPDFVGHTELVGAGGAQTVHGCCAPCGLSMQLGPEEMLDQGADPEGWAV